MLGVRRRSLVELAAPGLQAGLSRPRAASGGAAGRRLTVACGGCRVATAVSFCRPRWLMDWTGADERVTAADRTTARRVCAAGRT